MSPIRGSPVTCLLGAAALGLALVPGAHDRWLLVVGDGCARQPWGLVTGHVVHGTGIHLVANLLLFLPLSFLRERRRGSSVYSLELGALAVSVAAGVFLLHPGWTTYQGLSGLVYGLLAATLVDAIIERRAARLGAALVLAALGIKTLGELAAGGWLSNGDALGVAYGITYLPGSHAGGLIAGAVVGLVGARSLQPGVGRQRDRWWLAAGAGRPRAAALLSVRRARAPASDASACGSPLRRQ